MEFYLPDDKLQLSYELARSIEAVQVYNAAQHRRGRVGMHGHLTVRRADGTVMLEAGNMMVYAGLADVVAKMLDGTALNTYKYVAFGTGTDATANADTTLGNEVTGGTYARLTATQSTGDNTREYRLAGTWTNNSGSTQVVTEYGIFNRATWNAGTLLARVSTGDTSPPNSKTVEDSETLTITWDIQLQDA